MDQWIPPLEFPNLGCSDGLSPRRPCHVFHNGKPYGFSSNGIEVIRPWEQMSHCVAGSADRFVAGAIASYRVMKPERATAALQKRGDCWTLSEVNDPSNREISHDANCGLATWYSEAAYEAHEAIPVGEDDRQQAFDFEEAPF